MWHISGVAFHALPLGEHIPEALVKLGIWKFDWYDGPAGGEFYDFVHRAGSATISGGLLWSVCFLVLHLGANFGIDA